MAQMKQVIAVTEIHRTLEPGVRATKDAPGKPPKTQVIEAGTIFVPNDEDEDKFLRATGAVREPDPGERVSVTIEQASRLSGDEEPAKAGKTTKGKSSKKAEDDLI